MTDVTGFSSTPTPKEFQTALAEWLDAETEVLRPFAAEEPPTLEEVVELERAFLRKLYDAGWSRWGWPEYAGGLGGTALLRGALYEQLWASGYRVPEAFLPLETMGPVLVKFAPELTQRYLTKYLSGDELWCQGFSEPDAGSDLAALRLKAVDESDVWVVSGQKVWTSYGHLAQHCALLARTGEAGTAHRGLSLFFVDMDWPGVTVLPVRAITGRNDFAEIFFDQVRVPKDRLIGEVNGGWGVAMYLLQWERGMYGWQRQAMLHAYLEQIVSGADRKAPNLPPLIGQAYEAIVALRVKTRSTLARLASGENPGPEISVDKVLLATAEQTVLDLAREVDPTGFALGDRSTDGHWRGKYFYSRAASIYGGAAEIQRTILAERLLDLPREPAHGR